MSDASLPEPDSATEQAIAEALGPGLLRTDVVRRVGQGHIAGVCAALATAGGLPVRLVRAAALILLALGVGLPLYLLAALVLPRETIAAGRRETGRPVLALLRGRLGRGDALIALALIPSMVVGGYWLWLVAALAPSALWLLIPLLLLLLVVMGAGAIRARRARTAYLFAQIARRAGVIGPAELAQTVRILRRRAPRIWEGEDPEIATMREDDEQSGALVGPRTRGVREDGAVRPGATGAGAAGAGAAATRAGARSAGPGRAIPGSHDGTGSRASRLRARRPQPARRLGQRPTMIAVAALLIVGTLAFCAVSLAPGIAPGFTDAEPLPGIGRMGAAMAVVTVAAGILLIIVGVLHRRSLALSLVGLLAFSGFAGSVLWVRLTDGSTAEPIVVALDSYRPGMTIGCDGGNPRQWSRTVVLDMSAMAMPTDLTAVAAQARAIYEVEEDGSVPLSMDVWCDRPVGDVEVILPREVPVESTIATDLGEAHGEVPGAHPVRAPGEIVVTLEGSLGVGDITYRRAS